MCEPQSYLTNVGHRLPEGLIGHVRGPSELPSKRGAFMGLFPKQRTGVDPGLPVA